MYKRQGRPLSKCGHATIGVQTVGAVVDGVAGATFGAALVSSGMVRHAKVGSPLTALSPAVCERSVSRNRCSQVVKTLPT